MSRLIDADELRKNVLKWMPSDPCGKEEKEFPFETDICASMVMEIDDAPTVQPERIKGHWIEIASSNHTYKCSVCGKLLTNITDGKNKVAKNYPYCHCGADMRGE